MSRISVLLVVLACAGCGQSDIERRVGELEKRSVALQETVTRHDKYLVASDGLLKSLAAESNDKADARIQELDAEIRKTEEETRRLQGQ